VKISEQLTLIPYFHGKLVFARQVRNLCLQNRYDCIAVDIPGIFETDIRAAVENLPIISALVAKDSDKMVYYCPIDPCDAAIEAVRQGLQNHLPVFCIGSPFLKEPSLLHSLPDEYAATKTGFEAYNTLCLKVIGNAESGSNEDLEGQYCAHRIHQLRSRFNNILVLVHFSKYVRTVYHFKQEKTYNLSFPENNDYSIHKFIINPDHLYFALGELPFITGKYEKERYDIFSDPFDIIDTVKDLFRETRDEYSEQDEILELSPVRIQTALTYLRNLTIMTERFIPSLFDIVEAAKGVGGNSFAVRILKSAKYYPYIPFEKRSEILGIGIDRVSSQSLGGVFEAVNLFRDFKMAWRTISIKPDPVLNSKKQYKFSWNPFSMCSHVPEDIRIERFNSYVRKKAVKILVEDYIKSEKFSTSVKDGIDIRETLRNWHTGGIYVKEIPPSRGKVDTVIIIFDQNHDEKYPHCTTWYAEHENESTLSFYATDPYENLTGPGISRCYYGGLALLYPPRNTPDIFHFTRNLQFPNLASRLTYGALLFSSEKSVAYIAQKKPDTQLKQMASSLKKHLVWIPLNRFSNETLRRLRRFHILNGKIVRSWANRYIGD